MYQCPNCAGNLKFNIGKQALFCEYCENTMDPYAFHKEQDAEENQYFEVTVYSCPQCGGELLTEDTTTATFCSYCGGSTILDSRISKEKQPTFIIPFTKTEKDCQKSYQKMMRKAFFAPKELKDAKHIEKFRGIYMPYWVYSFRKNGEASFKGGKETYEKGFDVTKHYDIKCQVNATYNGLAYDASTTFYDNLSSTITPFDMSKKKLFTPSFLSGFYADSSDIGQELYYGDAKKVVMDDIYTSLKKDKQFSDYDVKKHMKNASMEETLMPECVDTELAMLPVWFLAYRKKDRVAYAVVNGQTGEAAADLPIDIGKFVISSLLLAIPIILILNMLFTFTPSKLLSLCMIIASLFAIVANNMSTSILLKESYKDYKLAQAQELEEKRQKKKFQDFVLGTIVVLWQLPFLIGFLFVEFPAKSIILSMVAVIIFVTYLALDLKYQKKPKDTQNIDMAIYSEIWKKKLYIVLKPIITIVIALPILLINPASDLIFYSCALLCLGLICLTIRDILQCHNILTTRKLPQLNKRGGDDYE